MTSSSGGSSGGVLCPPVDCAAACAYGFAAGPNGCLTCQCLPDPRACSELDATQCQTNPQCAAVSFTDATGARTECCNRDPNGAITCSAPPPPPVCMMDSECRGGQICNTWDYCERAPQCTGTGPCSPVCYGRCVAQAGGCASDYDCRDAEMCAFPDTAPPCTNDPNSGACAVRNNGVCTPVACPAIGILCPDGNPPTAYETVAHGCPNPICGGSCTNLTPSQCELRPDCQAVYAGANCVCECDPTTGACPPCACPSPTFECVSRPQCFSDQQCSSTEYCDFSYDTCTNCGRPALGVCVPRANICANLDERTCNTTPGCQAMYGDICPPCMPGSTCACAPGFVACVGSTTPYCSRDLDCGPGFRCNLCPGDPNCPSCAVCGAPQCEPAPPQRCTGDADCGPGNVCRVEACSNSIPPSCVGSCIPAPSGCANLDEASCQAAPRCRPLYDRGCLDGCHDAQGRLTSCGPCTDIACQVSAFTSCEDAPFDACCSDGECGSGEHCVFIRDVNLGECQANVTACGPNLGSCPAGSACEVVGCAANCTGTGTGGSPACCAEYACVAVNACASDVDCGSGMRCNLCPSTCTDPNLPCAAVCGTPRCESLPPGQCRSSLDCGTGCSCRLGPDPNAPGSCVGPTDAACTDRPFRVCQDDTQCLPDELCQRCPPGAACFVADHCAPRDRPLRTCNADAECLADEHCGNTCTPGAVCDQLNHCVPGAPGLRACASNLECRPDEYCQLCPPGAACLVANHCEPRGFRTCANDMQCLPDEVCQLCPPGAACLVADHCELRTFRACMGDAQCLAGEHCEMCPPGANCLVPDHCVANVRTGP